MAVEILLPPAGASASVGAIAEWRAAEGEAVVEGQALFVVEGLADPVGAPSTGTLRILGKAGLTHEVGAVVGYIE